LLRRLVTGTWRSVCRLPAAIGRFGRWLVRAVVALPATSRRLAVGSWRSALSGCRRLAASAKGWPAVAWRLRGPVLMAVSVGGAIGWGCYVAGPIIASTVGGLAGAAETLSARAKRLQIHR
jgi:hypothetical protein